MQARAPESTVPANPVTLDAKTFAIGVLSVTATILFVGFLVVSMLPRTALAIGQSDRGGDYVMLTEQVSNSVEALIVIDAASKRLILYGYDAGQKQLRILQRNVPLDRLPGARPENPQP